MDQGRLKHLMRWSALIACLGCVSILVGLATATQASAVCPNEGLRIGPSAALPDCRAYELITPPDTNGRLVEAVNMLALGSSYEMFPTELASPARDSAVYMTYSSPLLDKGEATGVFDLYEAERAEHGWSTLRRLTPSGSQAVFPYVGGVSSDHRYAFTHVSADPGRPAGDLAGPTGTSYLSNPDGSFEVTGVGELGTEPLSQGRFISEGGLHVIFSTGKQPLQSKWCALESSNCKVKQLETQAPPTGTGAVYDRPADGPTRVVSLLPNNLPPAAGEEAFYKGAAANGNAVAFAINGVLYVRIDNSETKEVASGEPTYAGLSEDGHYLFYIADGDIHRFDTEPGVYDQISSSGEAKVVNISDDGSHVYFISEVEIDGEGSGGQPNLYVWHDDDIDYVTTVTPSDLERTSGTLVNTPALTNWTTWVTNPPQSGGEQGPGADSSRTTPDGSVLVFESRANLTAYENAGHTEIYRYSTTDQSLKCISCSPLSPVASSDARLQELTLVNSPIVLNNVSDDGARVFFETSEALVESDSDGVNDIYEWRDGEGSQLISSGSSLDYPLLPGVEAPYAPKPNVLLSVTPDAEDVVFMSQDSLAPGGGIGGTNGIYDARIGGGVPSSAPSMGCSEETCRPMGTAETRSFPTPQSEKTSGAGNVKPRKRRCRRAQVDARHRGHRRCSRQQQHKARAPTKRAQESHLLALTTSQETTSSTSRSPADGSLEPGKIATTADAEATSEFSEFGIRAVAAETSTAAAGMHPDVTTFLELNHHLSKQGLPTADGRAEEVSVSLPPGLLGNPNGLQRCSTGEFGAFANCPVSSQVGIATVTIDNFGDLTEPIYNLVPPHPGEEVARFGFLGYLYPVFIDIKVRTAGDYGVTATVPSSPSLSPLLAARTTFWGNPADSVHDPQRLTAHEAILCAETGTACKVPGGKRSSELPPTAFMTNPSACQSQSVGFQVKSYQLPGQVFGATAPLDPIIDCQGLPFAPNLQAEPTNSVAGAPTGLKATLTLPQASIEAVDSPSAAAMREARVTLPAGMQIAATAADGLGVCSEAEVGFHQEVKAGCPDASKLGTVTIRSPALPEPLEGSLYQRTPTPGHQFGLWLVTDDLGLHVKLPGEIQPDPASGRLTAVFGDLPQVPVEEIDLDVWGGPRAPLKNPDACGTYNSDFVFAPHSNDPPARGTNSFEIDEGCSRGFDPKLHAGVTNPRAGAYSPFVFDLARKEGDQPVQGFELTLPDGELAKIKGVPLCSDTAAATGSCPVDSRIGHLAAASGPGPSSLWLPQLGKAEPFVYLAGPHDGSPFSVVSVVPAQAGPFDLGNVVVRSGLDLDPETAEAVVRANPLPQFFEGVGIDYRHLHVVIDRPRFTLNPTDCRKMKVAAAVQSTLGAVAHPSSRFQVGGCRRLRFEPKLSLELQGGTERGDYPRLVARLDARRGDANIGAVSVALPHSEFLAQEHIVTICTRKRFAADNCPEGSVYGYAKAWTSLLSKPLAGPVYLRSSDHPLPDLVAALGGELDVNLIGRIDSHNQGIRTTFDSVPDAPVSRFVLRMKGGSKGLLVNSQSICRGVHSATVAMGAQNGRRLALHPRLQPACGSAASRRTSSSHNR